MISDLRKIEAISIHVPREGHDSTTFSAGVQRSISIHVPREGHDGSNPSFCAKSTKFQSTCPARGTTTRTPCRASRSRFQSTCPARGTTESEDDAENYVTFQSTCPARGTTGTEPTEGGATTYFNPRAPRGARQERESLYRRNGGISIHVPREGHDQLSSGSCARQAIFQSTCPARGTTRPAWCKRRDYKYFNPRAPRGARLTGSRCSRQLTDFNPRAPRGARPAYHRLGDGHDAFQSTCPARGTTRLDRQQS